MATEAGSETGHPPGPIGCPALQGGIEDKEHTRTTDIAIVPQDGMAVPEIVVVEVKLFL